LQCWGLNPEPHHIHQVSTVSLSYTPSLGLTLW
jgi:hypothetical protein